MSYSTVYIIDNDGDVVTYTQVLNSTLPLTIWDYISKQYGLHHMFGENPEIWKWFCKGKIKAHYDIVMGFTFDHVIVYKEDIPKLINAFNKFMQECPSESMKEHIDILNEIQNDDIVGVTWQQTSVSEPLWEINPMWEINDDDEYDEDLDVTTPYNINTGNKHWDLFEHLNMKEKN